MKRIPVYKKEGNIFVLVGEIDEEIAKELVGDPHVASVEAMYILEEDETERFLEEYEEEKKIHEFKIEEVEI